MIASHLQMAGSRATTLHHAAISGAKTAVELLIIHGSI